jgi:hypothetical protein
MRRPLIAAVVPGLFAINAAIAQVDGTTTAMPGIAVTSPLGITSGTPVGGTGIKWHYCVIDPGIGLARGRRSSHRNSTGFYRDRQPRCQFRSGCADAGGIAGCGRLRVKPGVADHPLRYISSNRLYGDGLRDGHRLFEHRNHRRQQPDPANDNHPRRLLTTRICEQEQP